MELVSSGLGELSRALPLAGILYPRQNSLRTSVSAGFPSLARRLYLDPYCPEDRADTYLAHKVYVIPPDLRRLRRLVEVLDHRLLVPPANYRWVLVRIGHKKPFELALELQDSVRTHLFRMLRREYPNMRVRILSAAIQILYSYHFSRTKKSLEQFPPGHEVDRLSNHPFRLFRSKVFTRARLLAEHSVFSKPHLHLER